MTRKYNLQYNRGSIAYTMFIDNTKELFKRLHNIPALTGYMDAVEDDDMQDDLVDLISIIKYNVTEPLHYGGEGSIRWDLQQCENEQEEEELIRDYNRIKAIYRRIQKELNAKYILQCTKCGHNYFKSKNSSRVKDVRENGKNARVVCQCRGALKVLTMEEWCKQNNINLEKLKRA